MNAYEKWFGQPATPSVDAEVPGSLTDEVEIGAGAPTALYRLFAADGTLLYVGITGNPGLRFGQHAADKAWWPEVARKTAAWFSSRDVALNAEAEAIRDEQPVHNISRPLRSVSTGGMRIRDESPVPYADYKLLIDICAYLLSAKQEDVAAWHAQMVVTGASKLAQVFQPAERAA